MRTANWWDDRLEPVFQPLRRPDGSLLGFEALARWRLADDALVGPGVGFAEGASESSTSLRMLQLVGGLAGVLPAGELLSVNIPVSVLGSEALRDRVSAAVSSGVSLMLEVLEREPLDGADVVEHVGRLRSLGAVLALDDVGDGFADVSAVARLRPDVVKVSSALWAMSEPRAFLAEVVSACPGGSLMVVEGVEERAQALLALSGGASALQGWLAGRPVSVGGLGSAREVPPGWSFESVAPPGRSGPSVGARHVRCARSAGRSGIESMGR